MTTRLSVTITANAVSDGPSKRAECTQIAMLLERVAQQIQTTHATSGTITDNNGNAVCTYTYTPTASA